MPCLLSYYSLLLHCIAIGRVLSVGSPIRWDAVGQSPIGVDEAPLFFSEVVARFLFLTFVLFSFLTFVLFSCSETVHSMGVTAIL